LNGPTIASAHQSNRFRGLSYGAVQNIFSGALRDGRILPPVFHVRSEHSDCRVDQRSKPEMRGLFYLRS
jgi:hypothetical protein